MSNPEAAKDAAKQEAGNVAGTAKGEVGNVATAAQEQARNVLDDARMMVDDQSRSQRDRLVEFTRSVSDDLEQMAQNGPSGTSADIARQVAGKVRDVGNRIDGREPGEILDEVRSFARQRPGTFLLGAVVAGVVAGRLARGSKDARSSQGSQSFQGPGSNQGVNQGLSGSPTTSPGAGMQPDVRPVSVGEVGPIPGYSTGTPDSVGETGYGTSGTGSTGTSTGTSTGISTGTSTGGTTGSTSGGDTATFPAAPSTGEGEPPLYVETTERRP